MIYFGLSLRIGENKIKFAVERKFNYRVYVGLALIVDCMTAGCQLWYNKRSAVLCIYLEAPNSGTLCLDGNRSSEVLASIDGILTELLLDSQDLGSHQCLSIYKHRKLHTWFNLARRSERAGAPVLICPARRPTTMSAIVTSSVSPDRWETMTPQPAA